MFTVGPADARIGVATRTAAAGGLPVGFLGASAGHPEAPWRQVVQPKILTVKLLAAGVALLGIASATAGAAVLPTSAQPAAAGLLTSLGLSVPGSEAGVSAGASSAGQAGADSGRPHRDDHPVATADVLAST